MVRGLRAGFVADGFGCELGTKQDGPVAVDQTDESSARRSAEGHLRRCNTGRHAAVVLPAAAPGGEVVGHGQAEVVRLDEVSACDAVTSPSPATYQTRRPPIWIARAKFGWPVILPKLEFVGVRL